MHAPAPPTTSLRRLALALVGTGRWGRCIARELAQVPGARIVCAVNRAGLRPPELPPEIPLLPHWQPALEIPGLDGVLIATPADAHVAVVESALARGLPVFVEKPLAPDLASARVCLEHAQRLGLPFLVDHVLLFHPGIRLLLAAVRAAGPVEAIRAEAFDRGPARTDADLLLDRGPHDLALSVALLGKGVRLFQALRSARESVGERTGGEALELSLSGPAGQPVHIALSNLRERKWRRFAVRAAGRWFSFEDDGECAATWVYEGALDGRRSSLDPLHGRALHNALTAFCDAIRAGAPTPDWIALAWRVSELQEDARCALRARPFPVP